MKQFCLIVSRKMHCPGNPCCFPGLLLSLLCLLVAGKTLAAPTRCYVDSANVSGIQDGLSWATAYSKFETAIADSTVVAGDTIWVAKGTYLPAVSGWFTMKAKVAVYGGFTNTDTSVSQRNWTTNKTILKGNGTNVIRNTAAMDSTAILDGFIITGGSGAVSGGGMNNSAGASPKIVNTVFSNNIINGQGGGMYNTGASPILVNVTIAGCKGNQGGGMYNTVGSAPILRNVVFDSNIVSTGLAYGGGMYNLSSSSPKLYNVSFTNNTVTGTGTGYGGGMYCSNSSPTMVDVTFSGNTVTGGSGGYGGALALSLSPATLTRVSFVNNKIVSASPTGSGSNYGGAFSDANSSPVLKNVTFSGNTIVAAGANGSGGGFYSANSAAKLDSVFFLDNKLVCNYAMGGGIAIASNANPVLNDVLFRGNTAIGGTTSGGAFNQVTGTATLTRVSFLSNKDSANSSAYGGALNINQGTIALTDVAVKYNTSISRTDIVSGGGLHFDGPSATMDRVEISNNTCIAAGNGSNSFSQGGGVDISLGRMRMRNVVVSRNACTSAIAGRAQGGGLYAYNNDTASSNFYTNVVFSENVAGYGNALYNWRASSVITNCTFSNNSAGYYDIYEDSSFLKMTNSILFQGGLGLEQVRRRVSVISNCWAKNTLPGSNNLASTAIPFMNYVLPEGPDGVWMTADDGLRLRQGLSITPVNTGTLISAATHTTESANAAAADITGIARPQGGAYDMGAYEGAFAKGATRFYVDSANVNGTHNGLGWTTAFNKLKDAYQAAMAGDTIWVARGTYRPDSAASFTLGLDVVTYGGFKNTDTSMVQRTTTNQTILKGNGSSVIRNDFTNTRRMGYRTILDGFVITGGTTTGNGGGMFNNYAAPALNNVVITGNTAANGGGLYNSNASPVLTNVVVHNNTAGSNGGGMLNANAGPMSVQVTYALNTAPNGGGIYNDLTATPRFTNCVFWGNGTDIATAGGYSQVLYCLAASAQPGAGNEQTSISPFINDTMPAGPDGKWMTADDGLQPLYGITPTAVNSGKILTTSDMVVPDYDAVLATAARDITGASRTTSVTYDKGAYERVPAIATRYYVDSASTASYQDGLSWSTAYRRLDIAMDDEGVAAGDTICVAAGTYSPSVNKSYNLKRGVAVYGGFSNTGNDFTLRNWKRYKTVLKGNGSSVIRNAFTPADPMGITTRLDGFIITGGVGASGGGIYNEYASPVLENLVITGNTTNNGGGIYNASSSPVVKRVTLSDNSASVYGGGMYNSQSAPLLADVVFERNSAVSAYSKGGGMYNWNASPVMNRVVFDSNSAVSEGGGLYVQNEYSSPVVTNAVFCRNRADAGGGMYSSGNVRLRNATFFKNTAISYGGAIESGSPLVLQHGPDVSNCIAWENNSGSGNPQDNVRLGGNVHASYNFFQFKARFSNDSTGLIIGAASPFINGSSPEGPDGTWLTDDDGLQLNYCTPALNNGRNDSAAFFTTDILGRLRINGNTVDMGAYEKQSNTAAGQFGQNAALSNGSANALPFLQACDDNGWTYYADPSRPDSLSFAISWGAGNDTAKAQAKVYIKLEDHLSGAHDATSGIWSMRRYWNVDLNGSTLLNPVRVRFYYNPADTLVMYDSLYHAGINGITGKIEWFKTTGVLFDPSLVTATNINGGNKIVMIPTYGRDNNVAYAQFDNITSFSGGTAALTAGKAVPLPVKLLSFKAARGRNDAYINTGWKVAAEQISHYEVERSTDAILFEKAGIIKAQGLEDYSFTDELPVRLQHRDLFYRLKLADAGGSYTYSNIVSVRFNTGGTLSLSPNPAKDQVTIMNADPALNGATACVTDVMGRTIHTFTIAAGMMVDISSWAPGIYLVKTPDGNVKKLIKE